MKRSLKDTVLAPFDTLYGLVATGTECSYCIAYRFLALGLVTGFVAGLTVRIFG